jgi:hypothetical protein
MYYLICFCLPKGDPLFCILHIFPSEEFSIGFQYKYHLAFAVTIKGKEQESQQVHAKDKIFQDYPY